MGQFASGGRRRRRSSHHNNSLVRWAKQMGLTNQGLLAGLTVGFMCVFFLIVDDIWQSLQKVPENPPTLSEQKQDR